MVVSPRPHFSFSPLQLFFYQPFSWISPRDFNCVVVLKMMMLPRRCPSAATNVLRRQAALVPSSTSKRTLTLSACAATNAAAARQPSSVPASRRAAAAVATLPVAPFSSRRAFHVSPIHLAETVKVPQMAESITEGTLKQWNKKKGDFVKADEEVATIETDKVRRFFAFRSFSHKRLEDG